MSPEDYFLIIDQEKAAETLFLAAQIQKVNKKLYSQIWKNIHYTHANKVYAYLVLADRFTMDQKRALLSRYYHAGGFQSADYERDETPVFQNALKTYLRYEFLVYPDPADAKALYDLIGAKIEGYDKFFLQKELLVEAFKVSDSPQLAQLKFEQFSKDAALYPELIKAVSDSLSGRLTVLQKEKAPDFKILLSDGSTTSLSDYKGKVAPMTDSRNPTMVEF